MPELKKYRFLNSRLLFVVVALTVSITLTTSLIPVGGISFASGSVQLAFAEELTQQESQDENKQDEEAEDKGINLLDMFWGNSSDDNSDDNSDDQLMSTGAIADDNQESQENSEDESSEQDGQSDTTAINEQAKDDSLNNKLSGMNLSLQDLSSSKTATSETLDSNQTQDTNTTFPTGSGTEADPYLVGNSEQFESLRNIFKSNHYANVKLTSDIYTSTTQQWAPFCDDSDSAFCGVIDGNNHTISIAGTGDEPTSKGGLFWYLSSNATIKNLTVSANLYIEKSHGGIFANEIVSDAKNVSFSNCTSTGQLKSNGGYDGAQFGGFIGYVNDGASVTMDTCTNKASLSADNSHTRYAGGLIGYVNDDDIALTNCTNEGEISCQGAASNEYKWGIFAVQFIFMVLLGKAAHDYDKQYVHKKFIESYKKSFQDFSIRYPDKANDFLNLIDVGAFKLSDDANEIVKAFLFKKYAGNDCSFFDVIMDLASWSSKKGAVNDIQKELVEVFKKCGFKNINDCMQRACDASNAIWYTQTTDGKTFGLTFKQACILPHNLHFADIEQYLNESQKKEMWDQILGEDTSLGRVLNSKSYIKDMKYVADMDDSSISQWYETHILPTKSNEFTTLQQFKDFCASIKNQDVVDVKALLLDNSKREQYFQFLQGVFDWNTDYYNLMKTDNQWRFADSFRKAVSEYERLHVNLNPTCAYENLNTQAYGVMSSRTEIFKEIADKTVNNFVTDYKDIVFKNNWALEADVDLISQLDQGLKDALWIDAFSRACANDELLYRNMNLFVKILPEQTILLQKVQDIALRSNISYKCLDIDAISQQVSSLNNTYAELTMMSSSSLWSNKLAQAAASLATGDGGLGGVHWNAYGAGLVGFCDGDKSGNKLNITNCKNDATITGGHAAGGLVAYAENYDINIKGCSNSGSVGCSDNMCEPSSGGIIGSCTNVEAGQSINITNSISSGTILSRSIAGGIFGQIDDGDLAVNITNCGATGGIASPNYCGGIVGYEDSVGKLAINNCYSYCVYDTFTLNTTQLNWSTWLPIPGFQDMNLNATKSGCTPGAIAGGLDDPGMSELKGCYYISGNNAVGPKEDSKCPNADQVFEVGPDDFSQGIVTYKLNNGSVSEDAPFGQVIDDLTLGEGSQMTLPAPGTNAPVYRNEHSSNTIYTNYNPRTNKLYQASFFANHATISPESNTVSVKEGNSYSFSVTPDNAYEIDKVVCTNGSGETTELKEVSSSNDSASLSSLLVLNGTSSDQSSNSSNAKKYCIENVTSNLIVNVYTKNFDINKPEGLGTKDSPYQITNLSNLVWFITEVNKGTGYQLSASLCNDIDATGYQLTPMLNEAIGYSGTFDGCGHTISNISSADSSYAFFRYVNGGTISNLTLSGSFGSAAFADWAHDAQFINCTSKGSVSSSGIAAGGICARIWGTSNKFTSCTNECTVSNSCNDRFTCAGGICGLLTDGTVSDYDSNGRTACVDFTQCTNKGAVSSTSANDTHAAGILGLMNSWNRRGDLKAEGSVVNIKCCENAANIYGDGDQTSCGGIMGCVDDLMHTQRGSEGAAKLNIVKCINSGDIGYDSSGIAKSVQDASGILCWTYDSDLDVVIDSCVADGKIWCPDTTVSGGSGCAGFIANAENGCNFNIKNSYTTGNITSNHKYKGYFIGSFGTPIVCQWYTFIPFVFNLMAKTFKDIDTSPDINIDNNYYVKNGTPTDPFSDNGFEWSGTWEKPKGDNPTSASNNDLLFGALAYKINKDKDNPNYGQNIDNDKDTQTLPCLIEMDSRPTGKVYEINQGGGVYYTNNAPTSAAEGDYNITAETENGYIKGQLNGKPGTDLTITLSPKNNGYTLSEFWVDDAKIENPTDNTYTFKNINADHKVKAVFTNEKEPEKDADIDGHPTYKISNAQEYTWFVNKVNEGNAYNAKLVDNIDLSNYPECPQINTLSTVITSASSGYSIARDSNAALIKSTSSGAKINNINITARASDKQNNTAVLCKESTDLVIDNVKISGSISNIGGNSAAYVGTANGKLTISNCDSSIIISSNGDDDAHIAAFVGRKAQGTSTSTHDKVDIQNCSNSGSINTVNSEDSFAAAAIAFVESESVKYNVSGFENHGYITAKESAGSVFGQIETEDSYIDSSSDHDIENCINYGKISAENSGGFIGAINNTEDSTIWIRYCENAGDIYSINQNGENGDDSNSGGFIGYINDRDIDVEINGSCVTCNSIKADGEYAGGFVGFRNHDNNRTEIKNSFVYCTNISGTDYAGLIIGCDDDAGGWPTADEVYVYKPSGVSLKNIGDEDNSDFNKKINVASFSEFADGTIAIKLNEALDKNVFGQIIDYNGIKNDLCPHIKGQEIFKIEKQVGQEKRTIYTNYSDKEIKEKSDKLKVLSFENSDSSKGSSSPASDLFVTAGSDYTVSFTGFNGNALESLSINDQSITDKEVFRTGKYTIKNIQDNIKVKYKFGYGLKPEGSGTKSDPYKITIPTEWVWVIKSINSGEIANDVAIKITDNINMSGITLPPRVTFKGEIDGLLQNGQNAQVTNINGSASGETSQVAIFQQLDGATIKNVDFSVSFTGHHDIGGLSIEIIKSTLENVQMNGSLNYNGSAINDNPILGGFTCYSTDGGSKYKGCKSNMTIACTKEDEETMAGGFVGTNHNNTIQDVFNNCINNSSITTNLSSGYVRNEECDCAGGFIGNVANGTRNTYFFENCLNIGPINGDNVGGFVGKLSSNDSNDITLKFTSCANYGAITGDYAGGFIGEASKFKKTSCFNFLYCMNYGDITAAEKSWGVDGESAGGFVADIDMSGAWSDEGGDWVFYCCGNVGKITTYGSDSQNGGIIGSVYNVRDLAVDFCYSAGSQSYDSGQKKYSAQIIGDPKDDNIHTFGIYGLGDLHLLGREGADSENWGKIVVDSTGNRLSCHFAAKDFASGQVAHTMNSLEKREREHYGWWSVIHRENCFRQVLDNFTKTSQKQDYPDSTSNPSEDTNFVYALSNGTFSNYDPNVAGKTLHTIKVEISGPGTVNGSVANSSYHKYTGDNIGLTPKANDGCSITELKLVDASGKGVDVMDKLTSDNTLYIKNISQDYTLKVSFASEVKPKSGDGTKNNKYKVTSYPELLWVAKQINSGKTDICIQIENDIHATSYLQTLWTPIGESADKSYSGEFDGKGHTIQGLTALKGDKLAMFRYCNSANIHDFYLKNVNFWLTGDVKTAAGLCFQASGSTQIKNVAVDGKINASKYEAGLVNEVWGSFSATNCVCDVKMSKGMDKYAKVSGLINYIYPQGKDDINIELCSTGTNAAANSNDSTVGYKKGFYDQASGLVTSIEGSGKVNFKNCINMTEVVGDTAGGFVSEIKCDSNEIDVDFTNCNNISRVTGNNCGGILGKSSDVSKAHITFNGCVNTGFIGVAGAVIETAGGVIGNIDDTDCAVDVTNCCNYGTVINSKNATDSVSTSISAGSYGLSSFMAIAGIIKLIGAAVATSTAVPPAQMALAVIGVLVATGVFLYNMITTRAFTLQYAGGIVGEEDSCKDFNLTNVVNVGCVYGTSDSSGIGELDYESRCKLNNVYNLKSACAKNSYDHKDINHMDLQSFTSGEVGFNLQENSSGKYGSYWYGQIIDALDKGPRQSVPTFSDQSVKIYKINNEKTENKDVYTNFDPETYTQDTYALDVDYCCPDGSLETEDFSDAVDTKVAGDRSNEHKKQDNTESSTEENKNSNVLSTDKFSVLGAEVNIVNIKPIDNKLSVVKVEAFDKDNKQIAFTDSDLKYNDDGSVSLTLSERAAQNRTIKVYCVKNGIHYDTIDGKKIMMLPWNSTSELPNEELDYHSNNFYLTNDITTSSTFNCMKGQVNICLNGHSVTLSDKANGIIVNDDTSDLHIVDCNSSNSQHEYKLDADGRVSAINEISKDNSQFASQNESNKSVSSDSKINQDTKTITGGIIFGKIDASLVSVQKGAFTIDDVTLVSRDNANPVINFTAKYCQAQKDSSAVAASSTAQQSNETIAQNAQQEAIKKDIESGQYGEDAKNLLKQQESSSDTNKDTAKQYAVVDSKLVFNARVFKSAPSNGVINYVKNGTTEVAPLTIGSKAQFVDNSSADLYTNCIVNFDNDYEYNTPITVNYSGSENVTLTKGFDKQIIKGVDYQKIFKAFSSTKEIVLGGYGENANEILLINAGTSDSAKSYAEVVVNTTGAGKVVPSSSSEVQVGGNNVLKYAPLSDIKLHLQKEPHTDIDKITIKQNGQVVKTYDTSFTGDTLVFNGLDEGVTWALLSEKFEYEGMSYEQIMAEFYGMSVGNFVAREISMKNQIKHMPIKALENKSWYKEYMAYKNKANAIIEERNKKIADRDALAQNVVHTGDKIEFDVSFRPQIESVLEGSYTPWTSTTSMPSAPGRYILQNDIELGHEGDGNTIVWDVPEGVFTIDLNGHVIKQTAAGKNAIHVNSDKTVLTFTDSTMVGKAQSDLPTSMWVQKQKTTYTYNSNSSDIETYQVVDKTAVEQEVADIQNTAIAYEGLSDDEILKQLVTEGKITEELYESIYKGINSDNALSKALAKIAFGILLSEAKNERDKQIQEREEKLSQLTEAMYEVHGGAICGANVEPQGYYAYETKAGAIVVDKGVFYMHAGNIVANNSGALHLGSGQFNEVEKNNNNQGVEGGAAITINNGAHSAIYKDANIAYNSITGDKDYKSTYFSAAIANKGSLENYGNIENNTSYGYAASAVENDSATFVNCGNISNNQAKSDSFGAVYTTGDFTNSGTISNNFAEDSVSGVLSTGNFNISGNSTITDNTYSDSSSSSSSDEKDSVKKLDIYLLGDSKIYLNNDLKTTKSSVVMYENYGSSTFTSNWKNIDLDAKALFASTQESDVPCMDSTGELTFSDKDNTATVSFDKQGDGKFALTDSNLKPGLFVKGVSLKFNATANEGWNIDSVFSNGNEEIKSDSATTTTSTSSNSASETTNASDGDSSSSASTKEKTATYTISSLENDTTVTAYFVSDKELAARGDSIAWRYNNSLPDKSGKYILMSDVNLNSSWAAPAGDIQVDLNGHNILQNTANTSVINVNNAATKLVINDSKSDQEQVINLSEENKALEAYNLKVNINGGYIGGCSFSDTQDAAAIVVSDGEFLMNAGNISNNFSKGGNGAAALYTYKQNQDSTPVVKLGDKARIKYNLATCSSVAAAKFNNVELHNSATISNNYSDDTSVPGVRFENDNATLIAGTGNKIFNNQYLSGCCPANTTENLDVYFDNNVTNPISIDQAYESPANNASDAMHIKFSNTSYISNIVAGFEKLNCDISAIGSYFKSADTDYTISFYNDKQIDYCPVKDTVTYNFVNNAGGTASCNGEYVLTKDSGYEITYKAEANEGSGYKIQSLYFDEKMIDLSSDTTVDYKITNSSASLSNIANLDTQKHNITITFENTNKTVGSDSITEASLNATTWTDAWSMPTESGTYRLNLSSFSTLMSTCWEIPENAKIVLDLNGVTLQSSCEGSLVKLNKNSQLVLFDSKGLSHYFKAGPSGRYENSEMSGDIELKGGLVMGYINNISGCAFEVAKDAELSLNGINVVGFENTHLKDVNNPSSGYFDNNPGRGGAILNEGKVTIDENSSICGNIADIGGAIANIKGTVVSNANIYNNVAIGSGAGIYQDGTLMLGENSAIYDNKILDFGNKYQEVKTDDILINSQDPAYQPKMITNSKFAEVHKSYVSTTTEAWYENVPLITNAMAAFGNLTTIGTYFSIMLSATKKLFASENDLYVK